MSRLPLHRWISPRPGHARFGDGRPCWHWWFGYEGGSVTVQRLTRPLPPNPAAIAYGPGSMSGRCLGRNRRRSPQPH